jgi:hypothetical protein
MRNRQVQQLPFVKLRGEWRISRFGAQRDFFTDEFQVLIAQQSAGQKAGFDQNLEAVANAEHETALGRELADGVHDGGKTRNRAAAKVISIGESAGQDDRVYVTQIDGIVPDEFGFALAAMQVFIDGVPRIVVAIAARKNDDADFHARKFKFSNTIRPR